MEPNIIIAFGLGLVLLYLIGKVMVVPLKIVLKLLINGVIGGVVLWALNLFGAYFNLHIPLNPVTALVVGFLGVPGIALLVVIQNIIIK